MQPGTAQWLEQVDEEVIDPERAIIDPHHHLWPSGSFFGYDTAGLVADTRSGHNIVATVFIECRAAYDVDAAVGFEPIGETAFVAAAADSIASGHPGAPPIAGIVAHADLRDHMRLGDVLDAHTEAGGGRFRGIRDALSSAIEPGVLMIPGTAPADLSTDDDFRAGLRMLGERGLTYDTWHYHHQNHDFAELARSAPDVTMVLDHFGTPLGVGMYAGRRAEIFEEWRNGVAAVASCPNVVAKLGGLAMPDNGFGWNEADRPPTSDEFVEAQADYFHHTIDCFGPERCMFESNFPVDKLSLSYRVLWNAFKKIADRYTDDEQTAMFSGTAARIYRLDV